MHIHNENEIIDKVVNNLKKFYDEAHSELVHIGKTSKTEGEIRYAAGDLVEKLLQNIFDTLNQCIPSISIISKVGTTDYLSVSISYKGRTLTNDKIQVDRHVFSHKRRICFIENKTYLDSCYYDRALADFKKIVHAMKQNGDEPSDFSYIVFAGQNAASDDKLFFYEAEFYNDIKFLTKDNAGVPVKVFFFLEGKRSSSRPWYKIKHPLNIGTIREFTKYIIEII